MSKNIELINRILATLEPETHIANQLKDHIEATVGARMEAAKRKLSAEDFDKFAMGYLAEMGRVTDWQRYLLRVFYANAMIKHAEKLPNEHDRQVVLEATLAALGVNEPKISLVKGN